VRLFRRLRSSNELSSIPSRLKHLLFLLFEDVISLGDVYPRGNERHPTDESDCPAIERPESDSRYEANIHSSSSL